MCLRRKIKKVPKRWGVSFQMKLVTTFLLSAILFSSGSASACELTDEYKTVRNEITKSARESFNQCKASVLQAQNWYAFTQCIEQRDDKKIGGTCSRITGHNQKQYKLLSIDASHCNILGATSKEVKAIFEEHIKEKGTIKCKVT